MQKNSVKAKSVSGNSTSPSATVVIRVTVPEASRDAFQSACKKNNSKMPIELKKFMDKYTDRNDFNQAPALGEKTILSSGKTATDKQVHAKLTFSEWEDVHRILVAENCTATEWMTRIVRRQIDRGPQLLGDEVSILREATTQVRRVAIGVNQLANQAKNGGVEHAFMSDDLATKLVNKVNAVCDIMADIINKSTARE